ncbi:MAG: hypothetical protein JXA03_14225, partial [Bacteroidales bacterium]|nr:hypothetical protein [Bacteroidales bacterium]
GAGMNAVLTGIPGFPLAQPYNAAPWNYTGTESVTSIPNTGVVDWILLEFRDAVDASSALPSTMIGRQAAFLLEDGSAAGTDGNSPIPFSHVILNNLFVVIRHRNHLGVMSSGGLPETNGAYHWDFTTSSGQAFGGINAHNEIGPGIWGMAGADGNADNQVNNGDKNDVWTPQAGTGGYKYGDFNMDGQVNNGDKNDVWVPNTGSGGQVPE